MAASQDPTIADGTLDFSGGIDSIKTTTVQSQMNPGGLARNELAWLVNATVRDGGITQRHGFIKNGNICATPGLFQGGFLYRPTTGTPYLIFAISGNIYKYDPVTGACSNLSAQFNLSVQIPYKAPAGGYALELFTVSHPGGVVTTSGGIIALPPQISAVPAYTTAGYSFTVGSNGTLHMTQPYLGNIGDAIVWNVTGLGDSQFTVTSFTAAGAPTYSQQSPDSPTAASYYFCQAEQFLVIQIGDGVTLPLIWDGTTLRRSKGITDNAVAPGTPGVNEIPAATAMDYYMGRLWYAQGRQYSAGDIVGGSSGTLAYGFRDAVLNVTENPLVLGGDGFTVPISDGNIRAISHAANINTALGEGRLFIFTRKSILALQVPVTRTDWINATSSNQPLQTVAQLNNGSVNDRSITPVNGDLFFQSLEPGIRSLELSQRYFGQWGNIQISANENRILQFNDRSLMYAASGTFFDNRLLQAVLPRLTNHGVVHDAIIPLDFIPISSFGEQKRPNWEGMYDGIGVMQLFVGEFSGLERAFAFVLSEENPTAPQFQFWELTNYSKTDLADSNDGNRVRWIIETPSFTWGSPFDMKKLTSLEIWLDRLIGTVDFTVEYRQDGQVCWNPWTTFSLCSPKNSCEDAINPICYPLTPYRESYRTTIDLPAPDEACASATGRPTYIGNQFQARLTIKGWCRIRGLLLKANRFDKALYDSMPC